ncbi:MAG: 30S ribosomal protein S17 [Bdellovibrionaceae bacterium]|nr:30S ribosomal protein S17 [Pseudobdellovibrionaceae bacterium]
MSTEERGRTREVVGTVISDKMHKTISVKIYRTVMHPRYKKFVKRTSVFKAHDEKNEAKMGDKVRIYETRPLSKTKRWKLAEVVQKAEV